MTTTTRTDKITNSEDVIDSRDIIARIAYLEDDHEACGEAPEINGCPDAYEHAELEALRALAADGESAAPDWSYGETLTRDSYFRSYAMELAEDMGALPASPSWPLTCIDWDQAVSELQMDYTSVDFDGVTYWIR